MFADKIESEKSILPHIPTIGLLSRPDDDYCPCTTFCGIFVIGDWVWLWLWFFSFVLGFEYWALDNGFSVWGLVVCMSCHCSRACQQLRSVWSVFIAQLGGHSQQFPLPFVRHHICPDPRVIWMNQAPSFELRFIIFCSPVRSLPFFLLIYTIICGTSSSYHSLAPTNMILLWRKADRIGIGIRIAVVFENCLRIVASLQFEFLLIGAQKQRAELDKIRYI